MKTRALQGARLHQHGDSTIFMKLPPCEQVNLMLRSLAARAHGFVFGQNSVGMYAFTLSGDGTICQEGKGERAAGVHLSGAPNSRELMTSPTLLCSQQGHRHQPLMLIEGEGFGCEALRCLWMSKAWEAHSAGFCAPSQVWWRPPMDLRWTSVGPLQMKPLVVLWQVAQAQILPLMSRLRHVTTMAPLIGDSASGPFPIHRFHVSVTILWRFSLLSSSWAQLHQTLEQIEFSTVISACTFLCSPSLEALALPRFITSPRSLSIPRTQTAVMFVVPGGSSVPRGCSLRAAAA